MSDEEDLLSATGMLREQTAILPGIDEETAQVDLSDATGELPTIEAGRIDEGSLGAVDFPVGEASTLSEVGTKHDLARAYVDMGDPEGARSILDEVTVTDTRIDDTVFEAPYTINVVTREQFLDRRMSRTTLDALRETPGVAIQRTGYGQASPFIRGFTGFRTLTLIDGIRLNNAVFRGREHQNGR